jgi:uncharacterized protein involved in type VI secretion and phage assembly
MPLPADDQLPDRLASADRPDHRNRPAGAVIGLVTNNQDPQGWGRVKVKFPWLHDSVESHWCRIAQPYAGGGRGSFWLPEVGDEVVVVFDRGDPNHPYLLGGVWNGKDAPPPPGDPDGKNNHKIWRTRNAHQIIFQDTDGSEKITITDGKNQRHLVIDVAADSITLTADPGDITFEAPAESISVECVNLEIQASNNSTWNVDTEMSDQCKDRTETITGADSLKVGTTWNVTTKSATVSAASSKVTVDKASASVSSNLTLTNPGSRTTKSTTIKKTTGPETMVAGMVEIHADQTIALVANGPGTVTAGVMTVKAPDVRASTGAMLTVMGGLCNVQGKTAITAKASLVTVC